MNNLVKFSDGDGSDFTTETHLATIEVTENGYIVYLSTEEDDTKYAFQYKDRKEMMEFIGGVLGV